MSEQKSIRVCLKCRSYMILNETFENQKKLKIFNLKHKSHTLITAPYSEINNLECGKVTCEEDEVIEKLDYEKD